MTTVGDIRKAIEGLSDDAPAALCTVESDTLEEDVYLHLRGFAQLDGRLIVEVRVEGEDGDDEDDEEEEGDEFDPPVSCSSVAGHQRYHNPDFDPAYKCVVCDVLGERCGGCAGREGGCSECDGEGIRPVEPSLP